jgi:hypothetical protein
MSEPSRAEQLVIEQYARDVELLFRRKRNTVNTSFDTLWKMGVVAGITMAIMLESPKRYSPEFHVKLHQRLLDIAKQP